MSRKIAPIAALVIAALLSAWRASVILAGPDIDTDAYAHHMIARAIAQDPTDLGVHWVWLPLFHYLEVPLVLMGGSLDTVRWVNLVLAAALPLVLFAYVRRTTRSEHVHPDLVALVAAVLAAGCPIAMQMGTTGQPEPLFALLVLSFAIAVQTRRVLAAALLLGAAVMLRYEAWACFVVACAYAAAASLRAAVRAAPGGRARAAARVLTEDNAWTVIAVPAAFILIWAALRRPIDGRWFGFLHETRQFATGATHERSALDRGEIGLLHDALYYPVFVPLRLFGPALALAPLGIVRSVRQQGSRFVAVFAACLAFVSLSWVLRSSLGLDRHFVVLVALYATVMAQGSAALGDLAARLVRTRRAFWVGNATSATLAGLATLVVFANLSVWMTFWRASITRGLPGRTELAGFLRTLPVGPVIFCDDATFEIASDLDRRRFDRHWIDDPRTWDLVQDAAQRLGTAYVATWARKLRGHEHVGAVIFRASQPEADGDTGLAVMRVVGNESSGR